MAPQITATTPLKATATAIHDHKNPIEIPLTTSKTESTVDSSIPTLLSTFNPTQSKTNIGTNPFTNSLNLPIRTGIDTAPVPFSPNSLDLSLLSKTLALISSSSMPLSVSLQSSQSGTIQALDISSLSMSSTTISSSILPTDSPAASGEAPTMANTPGSPNTNTSRNRILGIAIILPILLICTGLIVLCIWRRRRKRATLLRPYRTSQNGVGDWEGSDSSCGSSQTVTPFVLSEKVQNADEAVMTIGAADTKRRLPATNTNVRSKRLSVRRVLNSVRKGALATTGAQHRVPKVPAEQSNIQNDDGGVRLVSESIHLHADTSRIVRTSLPNEADVLRLQESSVTQNAGLDSNVRYTTRGSDGSLDAELRAYIPPPKYTSTGASLFLRTNSDPALSR